MAPLCKTCSSQLREEVDRMLVTNNYKSYEDIAKWCLARGLEVSGKSIGEHARKHIKGFQPKSSNQESVAEDIGKPEFKQNPVNPLVIDIDELLKNKKCTDYNLVNLLKAETPIIIGNLYLLISEKIKYSAQGLCKLPTDEAKMLKDMITCYDIITGKENYKRSGNNIFDIETTLDHKNNSTDDDFDIKKMLSL